MKELKAIVRKGTVPDIVQALRRAGVTRFQVSPVHVLGAGVDPEHFRVSMEEGEAYTEKAKIELLCPADRAPELLGLIQSCASTGHRGDGIIVVTEVDEVINVRTGDRDSLALL